MITIENNLEKGDNNMVYYVTRNGDSYFKEYRRISRQKIISEDLNMTKRQLETKFKIRMMRKDIRLFLGGCL